MQNRKYIFGNFFALFFSWILLLTVKSEIYAQSSSFQDTDSSSRLIEEGFQNVSVTVKSDILLITYENRRFRFEPLALNTLFKRLDLSKYLNVKSLRIIALKFGLPVVQIDVVISDVLAFQKGQLTGELLSKKLDITQSIHQKIDGLKLKNKGTFKIEFEIEPHLRLGLGGFPDAVIHQINLRPTANIFLWKGAQVKLQSIVPISNEFIAIEQSWVRPGILVFNQYLRLPMNSWAKISTGYFEQFRYGGELTLGKYFMNGNLEVIGELGYTGYASYPIRLFVDRPKRGWQISDIDYWNYRLSLNYRISKWDFVIGVEAGRALFFRDYYRVHFYRQFREVKLGFFAYSNDGNRNYGFNLSIPLFPKKYWKPKFVSIRPSKNFQYYYQATQFRISEIKTGYNFDFVRDDFNPSFIKNNLN